VLKDSYKDSNVVSAAKRHLKDVQNVNQYGTAQGSVRLAIGLNIR